MFVCSYKSVLNTEMIIVERLNGEFVSALASSDEGRRFSSDQSRPVTIL